MAGITERNGKFTAQIRIKRKGKVIYTEAATHPTRKQAATWAKRREVELDAPGVLDALVAPAKGVTLAKAIQRYKEEFYKLAPWQVEKEQALNRIAASALGERDVTDVNKDVLVNYARERRAAGGGAVSVGNELSHISAVLQACSDVLGYKTDSHAAKDARKSCLKHGLVKKSGKRKRRPTKEELQQLHDWFAERRHGQKLPMNDLIDFAIFSTRRQAEMTRIVRSDFTPGNAFRQPTQWVRDVKHPKKKIGNDKESRLTDEAVAIIERQPRDSERIFPYSAKAICVAFANACKMLGIKNLRFHDLRHEGISQLFERGYQIQEVCQFSLHDTWEQLRDYTQLKPHQGRSLPAPSADQSAPQGPSPRPATVLSVIQNSGTREREAA